MRSTMRAMLLASIVLAVPGCVGSPVIGAAPSACADIVPAEWSNGVQGAPLPDAVADLPTGATDGQRAAQALALLKGWTAFGVDQSNRLDQANGRTKDAIGIVARCEARDAAAIKKARPKILGIF